MSEKASRRTKSKKSRKKRANRYPGSNQKIEKKIDAKIENEEPIEEEPVEEQVKQTSIESKKEEISTWTDYSVASPLERFALFLEQHMRKWNLSADEKTDFCAETFAEKSFVSSDKAHTFNGRKYELLYYFQPSSSSGVVSKSEPDSAFFSASMHAMCRRETDFPSQAHCLQRWFGVDRFLLVDPRNGTVVDTSEASAVLSALAIAADACGCSLPVFTPVGDVWRGVYIGYEVAQSGVVMRYDTRSVARLDDCAHLDGIVLFHNSRMGFDAPDETSVAARLTFEEEMDDRTNEWRGVEQIEEIDRASDDDDDDNDDEQDNGQSDEQDGEGYNEDSSEDSAPGIQERGSVVWAQFSDPVDLVQLGALWSRFALGTFADNEYNTELVANDAPSWTVRCMFYEYKTFQLTSSVCDMAFAHANSIGVRTLSELFVTDAVKQAMAKEQQKQHFAKLAASGGGGGGAEQEEKSAAAALDRLTGAGSSAALATTRVLQGTLRGTMGAVSRVGALTKSLASSIHIDRLPTAEDLDRAMNNIFARAQSGCSESLGASEGVLPQAPRVQGAKAGTLFFSFCLSAFSLGRLRPIAVLWRQFAKDIRWHWENRAQLAGTDVSDDLTIDLGQCLVQQKLEMLNYCIRRKLESGDASEEDLDDQDDESGGDDDEGDGDWDDFDIELPEDEQDEQDADAAMGRLKKLEFNLTSDDSVPVYEPVTQQQGPATEDMMSEWQEMLARLGTDEAAAQLRTQLQTAGLVSEMQAFKAANPKAALVDFVRWHSPNDFVDGKLSARMADTGNLWHKLWDKAKPVTVRNQKPLFECDKQANRALHYIETLTPLDLMTQILATVMRSVPCLLGWDCTSSTRAALKLPAVRDKALVPLIGTIERILGDGSALHTASMLKEDLEELKEAMQLTEQQLSRATSLYTKFPRCDKLVAQLLESGEAVVETKQERAAVCKFFESCGSNALQNEPVWKEFVVRTRAPRPMYDNEEADNDNEKKLLHRTYALVGNQEFRVACTISEEN